jgi:hypothetical protein
MSTTPSGSGGNPYAYFDIYGRNVRALSRLPPHFGILGVRCGMKGDSCLSNAEFVHYWEIPQFSFAVALSLAKKYIFLIRAVWKN